MDQDVEATVVCLASGAIVRVLDPKLVAADFDGELQPLRNAVCLEIGIADACFQAGAPEGGN